MAFCKLNLVQIEVGIYLLVIEIKCKLKENVYFKNYNEMYVIIYRYKHGFKRIVTFTEILLKTVCIQVDQIFLFIFIAW